MLQPKTCLKFAAILMVITGLVVEALYAESENLSFFSLFPKLNLKRWTISHGWTNGVHQSCEWRKEAVSVKGNDLLLTLSDKGGEIRPIGCAEIHTQALNGYGLYEARMRAAAGSGLNTAFFTYIGPPTGSPRWDEIDFEFLGKDTHTVQINYFTDGKSAGGKIIPLKYDASKEFHNYSFRWEPNQIIWYIDGSQVHATSDTMNLPQTPGRIYLSLWSGSKQEDDWLGHFTYMHPVTAQVSWVRFTPLQ
jgi:endo-1,3-1,4-beta-glycanase ExoK